MNEEFFSHDGYLKAVFDAVAAPLFVVDDDVRILDANVAGLRLVADPPQVLLRRPCGDVLHCINTVEPTQGCGKTKACPDCVVRNATREAMTGQRVSRQRAPLIIQEGGEVRDAHFLVTASPFEYGGVRRVLLSLEDITDLIMLRDLVRICANCKKTHNDEEIWERFESYLERHAGIKFSHGICPECLQQQHPELFE